MTFDDTTVKVYICTSRYVDSSCLQTSNDTTSNVNQLTELKPFFHLANLFARTDKKVGTRRIFSPANFNYSCCRNLVFALRRAKKCHQVENRLKVLSYPSSMITFLRSYKVSYPRIINSFTQSYGSNTSR